MCVGETGIGDKLCVGVSQLVSWCFQPSQPQRITVGLMCRGDRGLEASNT